jgi:hypothetical protein
MVNLHPHGVIVKLVKRESDKLIDIEQTYPYVEYRQRPPQLNDRLKTHPN